jgi:hypothetical protein
MKKYAHYNIEQYREKGEEEIEAKWTHQDKMSMVHMLDDLARKIDRLEDGMNEVQTMPEYQNRLYPPYILSNNNMKNKCAWAVTNKTKIVSIFLTRRDAEKDLKEWKMNGGYYEITKFYLTPQPY